MTKRELINLLESSPNGDAMPVFIETGKYVHGGTDTAWDEIISLSVSHKNLRVIIHMGANTIME